MKKQELESIYLFKIFSRICERWELTEEEQLGLLNMKNSSLLDRFKRRKAVPPEDVFRRIGYLLNIYRTLHVILDDGYAADTWIRRRNSAPMFKGKPAIKLMTSDVSGVKKVRDYVLSQLV